MATSTYFAGKSGSFTIGTATTIGIKSWKYTHEVQEQDTTATTSGGYGEVQGTIETLTGTLEAQYDTTSGPYTLAFAPGTYLTNLVLKVNSSDTTTHTTITSAFIRSVEVDMSVEDMVKYTIAFRSHGSWTKATK